MPGVAGRSEGNAGFVLQDHADDTQEFGIHPVVPFAVIPSANQSKTRASRQKSKRGNDWVPWNLGVAIMKYVHSLVVLLAVLGVLMFPTLSYAASLDPVDSSGVQVQPQLQNGISYLSGGIGEDEAKAIQQAKGYNLHMTFSVGSLNEYIPDVDVVIQKAQGQTVLTLNQAGPLVYVQLPAGKYTVVATRNGEVRRDVTDVGEGTARNLVFHWGEAD
jgi:hypothetical protein